MAVEFLGKVKTSRKSNTHRPQRNVSRKKIDYRRWKKIYECSLTREFLMIVHRALLFLKSSFVPLIIFEYKVMCVYAGTSVEMPMIWDDVNKSFHTHERQLLRQKPNIHFWCSRLFPFPWCKSKIGFKRTKSSNYFITWSFSATGNLVRSLFFISPLTLCGDCDQKEKGSLFLYSIFLVFVSCRH